MTMPSTQDCQGVARALMAVAADPNRTDELYEVLGEFCHGVRDRLNALKISLYVANQSLGPEFERSWQEIHDQYLVVEHFVDQFQTVFRPMSLNLMSVSLGRLIDENRDHWERLVHNKGANLFWSRPKADPEGRFDPMRLTDALERFVSGRTEEMLAGTMVHVSWTAEGDRFRFSWDEKTPAVSRTHASGLLADGYRLGNLVLPMLARVMALHGGVASIRSGDEFGMELRWPMIARDGSESPRTETALDGASLVARER
jgi:hypothetical protein